MKLHSSDDYVEGVLAGNRAILSRTVTLIESSLPSHQTVADEVIERLLPETGRSIRLGITGIPGAGKSTFIERLGMHVIKTGKKLGVLAVDPSSVKSGGSIMADKTRMETLAGNRHAYIRPSPSGGTLGGVARKTRETMLVCEAAGFDVIFVETVGVGQSELAVASMVDFFLILMIPGAGDEIQGMKKGVLEFADAVVVNKSDGNNVAKAEAAKKDLEFALNLLKPVSESWQPCVLTCSALEDNGIDAVWEKVLDHQKRFIQTGELERKRKSQAVEWLSYLIEDGLKSRFYGHPEIKAALKEITPDVQQGNKSPSAAAKSLLSML